MKRLVFTLICGSLLLISCAGPRGDSAGIINGTRISLPEYIRALQSNTIDFRSITKRPPDDAEKQMIFKDTWRNLSMRVILNEYYKKYRISVSEAEVIDTLSKNIPSFILSSDIFMADGKFDRELYLQSLIHDKPVNMSTIRKRFLEDYIPLQKLKPRIIDDELLDKKTKTKVAEIISGRLDFDLLVFDPDHTTVVLSETELKDYYQQNIQKYALEPIYSVSYFSIPIALQGEDFDYTQSVADSIYQEISHGMNFTTAVAKRSDYMSGLRVIESDFVRVENVDPEVLAILEPLPDNAQSKLIRHDNGFFIYQKLQRTKSMINYRMLQIPPVISPNTVNAQHSRALGAQSLARSLGMKNAAAELNTHLYQTDKVHPGESWFSDPLVISTIEASLMKQKKGDFLDPVYSPATGSWIVAQLTENQVNRAQPFNELRDSIASELQKTRQHQIAAQNADKWLREHPDLVVSANHPDYVLKQYSQSSVQATYQGEKLDTAILHAFIESKGKMDKLGDKSIIVIPRKLYPSEGRNADPAVTREYFVKTLSPNWFEEWMNGKLNQAKVQIYVTP
ncbi:MAG TPA: peptidylprolyl isomerase [Candidatus Cloacimonadota bacterium]|nr:peptidylprolyl isomerase [Candidatus Cloacimonadota bacterium]